MLCFGLQPWALGLDTALAQSPVILTLDAQTRGAPIPDDFTGLSFETSNLLPETNGQYLFSAKNLPLIILFKNIGVRNLRIGGGTVDLPRYPVPELADIDNLFAFAQAAGVKVIYSLRLLNGNKTNAAATAQYIMQHYPSQLACFAIGNEPDWSSYHVKDPKIRDYPTYLARWKEFAAAVAAAALSAKFAGPDTGSDYPVPGARNTDYRGRSWTAQFADDEMNLGIASIFQHDYVGQSAKGVDVQTAIDAMLSRTWITYYQTLHDRVLKPVMEDRLTYRMTECNDYTGGVNGASNAFAAALWALDYLHWWAAHGCAGVNFHNKKWLLTDTVYRDSAGNFQINPKAYGLKAFDLGSHGDIITAVKLSNPENLNVDCYAVGEATNLYVTIINKTHGSAGSADAMVTVEPRHFAATGGEYLILASAPASDCQARNATLGGATITSLSPWAGVWTPLSVDKAGKCTLTVKSTSAAVVRLY